jgi:phospholipid/cholesterol/gamma-HCH transport system substrate-binding protein
VRWLSRVVSVVVLGAILLIVAVLIRHRMPATHVGQSFRTWALFRDGSRLATGSPVMIAGVRVGEISSLAVVDGFARVDMILRDDTNIPADSWITKRAESAFGDSYLEIIPESAEEGTPPARELRSGERITHVMEGTSTDTALRTIAQAMPKIDNGLNRMHDVALDGRDWSHRVLEDKLAGAQHWLDDDGLDHALTSADHAMERFETGTTKAADAVHGFDTAKTFDRIDGTVTSARKQMANIKTGIRDSLHAARDGFDRIDPQVEQATQVMEAINEGSGQDWKGTLGRLVNKPDTANSIENATADVADATYSFNQFRAFLGLRAEYNFFSGEPRVYLIAEIRARNDKFYLIELEKGGLGENYDQLSDVPASGAFTRYQQIRDELRFTAQFGKQIGWLQVRGGLKDSTPGLGVDVLGNHLKLSVDLYGSLDRTPRLKITGAYEFFKSVYIVGGIDDALNSPHTLNIVTGNTDVPQWFDKLRYGRDYFLGGTLYFTDEDLAMMIRVYGALLVSLL